MQKILKDVFKKNSVLMWSAVIGSCLWIVNAAFNCAAKDYRAFFINLLYVVCLITLTGAIFKKEENDIQGMIGALLMISVVGNLNVLSEMIDEDIPSRTVWQLVFGLVIMMAIFINHFLISHSEYRNTRRIYISQILLLILILFRCYQIILNIISGEFNIFMIEVTVGMLAIIPTMNVIICTECRGDGYKIQ